MGGGYAAPSAMENVVPPAALPVISNNLTVFSNKRRHIMQKKLLQTLLMAAILTPGVGMAADTIGTIKQSSNHS